MIAIPTAPGADRRIQSKTVSPNTASNSGYAVTVENNLTAKDNPDRQWSGFFCTNVGLKAIAVLDAMPLNVPKTLTVGISTNWIADHPIYTSSDYNLVFNLAGADHIPTTTAPDGDGWLVEVDGDDTRNLDPGPYYWSARVVDQGEIGRSIGAGNLTLVADLATVDTPYDGRSPAQRILDSLYQAFEAMSGGKIKEYKIEGRETVYRDLGELTTAIEYWKRQVKLEQAEQDAMEGEPSQRTARVSFSL